MGEENGKFDEILEKISGNGSFLKKFNWFFNFGLILIACMTHMNLMFLVYTPDHWCFVPGREGTNYSLDNWKDIYIPRENIQHDSKYHKCKMYNTTLSRNTTIDCRFGWEYNTTWYKSTISIQENWVCDRVLHGTNALGFTRLGEVFGTFILGQLADKFGRKTIFYTNVLITLIGKTLLLLTTKWIYVFQLIVIISSLPATSVFQAPFIVAQEIATPKERGRIAVIQSIAWTFATSLMPLLMWAIGDWFYFGLITTLPCGFFLLLNKYIVESPRWLTNRGRFEEAEKVLNHIAKINKAKIPEYSWENKNKTPEKVYGVLSLFSSWRLGKNCFMLVYIWSTNSVMYLLLMFNASNIGGNPFLNLFFQSIVELPANIIAKFLSDRYGRRLSIALAFTGTFLACIPIICYIGSAKHSLMISVLSVFFKFSMTFSTFVVSIQSLEIYPTCIRQTGMSIGSIVGNTFAILPSYIIHWGSEVNLAIPYIISAILSITSLICGILLPETLNYKLPETLTEASVFGANQNWLGKEIKEKETEIPLK